MRDTWRPGARASSTRARTGAPRCTSYGLTDELGWSITENPVHVSDFHATLLQLFGFDHTKLGYEHLGVLQRLTPLTRESNAIAALMA